MTDAFVLGGVRTLSITGAKLPIRDGVDDGIRARTRAQLTTHISLLVRHTESATDRRRTHA
jgi:hypothetical protein